MTIEEEFDKWFQEQLDDGLVDFKLDVRSAPKGSTTDEVMAEILHCEKQIALGNVEEFPPEPDQQCSAGAQYIIGTYLFGTQFEQKDYDNIVEADKLGYTIDC